MLPLVAYKDIGHQKIKLPVEMRYGRFSERMDDCAQVCLRLFATAIEKSERERKAKYSATREFRRACPGLVVRRRCYQAHAPRTWDITDEETHDELLNVWKERMEY